MMTRQLLVILWVAAPTVGMPTRSCRNSDLDTDFGLRLVQVRASLVYRTATGAVPTELAGPDPGAPANASANVLASRSKRVRSAEAASQGEDLVAGAAIGLKVNHLTVPNGTSAPNEATSVPVKSLAPSVGNASLQDVIHTEEEKALINETVAKKGAKALTRRQQGKRTAQESKFEKAVASDTPNATLEDELNNETIQKAIRDRVEEAVDAEVVDKISREHRLPSQGELNRTVSNELREIWYDLLWARRHRKTFEVNVGLWNSIAFFDWCLLIVFLASFVLLYHWLLDWPTTRFFHGAALVIWIASAVLYNTFIYARLGSNAAIHWLIGYLLEFIFSVENLFVYHIIVKAFRMPRWITQRVLFIVVLYQITFQFVFYMGLGPWLRSLQVLPYLLGIWLIYLGCQAIMEEEHEDFDIMRSGAVSWIQVFLGDRLLLDNDGSGAFFATKNGKTCLCPAGLLLLALLAADFLMEVDVTVTKIEGFPSRYLCFSSSMVASFALPELFFVARDLFHRFFALKYGISFVLLFVGVQALLHDVFTVTALTSLAIIIGMIILSILVSVIFNLGKGFIGTENVGPRTVE